VAVTLARRLDDEAPRLVEQLLRELGEDPAREGLVETPDRVARSLRHLTEGYDMDAHDAVGDALFQEDYDEIVVVRDIPFYSLCLPSNQIVNTVGGAMRAGRVMPGDELYTLVDGEVRLTTVHRVARRHAGELTRVTTSAGTLFCTPDHPFGTPEGWVEARDLTGHRVEWTAPKALCRMRTEPHIGYELGDVVGATAADGSVGKRGVGARFTPSRQGSHALSTADSWERRHGFRQESHRTTLRESRWVDVVSVDTIQTGWRKPFTVYSFHCDPYPTFLVGGHLSHNCEHHMLPFFGQAHVAYAPQGRVVGLSKIPRLVDVYAHRLQLQERMTREIAEALQEVTQPGGVAVVVEARHLCMEMRGVEKSGQTVTSCMLGCFRDDARTRSEFLELIRRR
jgi:GTP cyclohydrolase I